MPKRNKKVV
ncbi:hypothetical protein CGLO_12781 [Colletotrichum gloeosporioides Cg-14]|uniref:Uncharacterized protein n=1 Tax=Colletotrichum gloeosporioides (strain Cg-14) TaxID=1237896 RepID=T0JXV3_COLGC|nr:hypothetical protein CGLO_12781 [Colletotrichum gloeosporioides Cg-14]